MLHGLDQEPDGNESKPILVLPRGSIRGPVRTVLTEEDHEDLYRRMGKLNPLLRKLFTGTRGTAFLFIGCHPRDIFLHQLCSNLFGGERRTQNPDERREKRKASPPPRRR